jgi:hypothetical protein
MFKSDDDVTLVVTAIRQPFLAEPACETFSAVLPFSDISCGLCWTHWGTVLVHEFGFAMEYSMQCKLLQKYDFACGLYCCTGVSQGVLAGNFFNLMIKFVGATTGLFEKVALVQPTRLVSDMRMGLDGYLYFLTKNVLKRANVYRRSPSGAIALYKTLDSDAYRFAVSMNGNVVFQCQLPDTTLVGPNALVSVRAKTFYCFAYGHDNRLYVYADGTLCVYE